VHGTPLKLLADRFPRFFYADYATWRESLDEAIDKGFRRYSIEIVDAVDAHEFYATGGRMSWSGISAGVKQVVAQIIVKKPSITRHS